MSSRTGRCSISVNNPTNRDRALASRCLCAVENRRELGLDQFQQMPQTQDVSDIHSWTSWSRYDNRWDGVRAQEVLKRRDAEPDAGFRGAAQYDGYTTISRWKILPPRAPYWRIIGRASRCRRTWRAIAPHRADLYFWKSAKCFRGSNSRVWTAGLLGSHGYHNRADPWTEQRYSDDP